MRKATTLTIRSELLAEIRSTKAARSTSDRVNELLRRGLELEKRESLEREAAEFFGTAGAKFDIERAASQKASKKALSRKVSDSRSSFKALHSYGTYPGPRSTFPGRAPVICPASITGTPFTSTYSIPSDS